MASLEFTVNGADKSLEMVKEKILIGRGVECEVQFPEDEEMSRQHCLIIRQEDGSFKLYDVNSTNGTCLNDKLIGPEPAVLQDGDEIAVGRAFLTFHK